MNWDVNDVAAWLHREHDLIYADLDRMRYKMRTEPNRRNYFRFISEQVAALDLCILLKDSIALSSRDLLNRELNRFAGEAESIYNMSRDKTELGLDHYKKGWANKIEEIRNRFVEEK